MGLLAADSPHSPASKGAVRGDSGGCYDAFVCCSMRRVLRVRKIGPRRRTGTTVFRLGSMRLPPQGPPSPRGGGRSFGSSFIGTCSFPFLVPAGCPREFVHNGRTVREARFLTGATSGTHAAGARHAAAGSKTAVRRGRRREGSPTAKVPGKPSGAVVGGGAARPWPHAGSERVLHEPCWAAEGIREPHHCARPAQAGAASGHLCAGHSRLRCRDERLIAQIGTGQLAARRVRRRRRATLSSWRR